MPDEGVIGEGIDFKGVKRPVILVRDGLRV
jgi:hypothetical protein